MVEQMRHDRTRKIKEEDEEDDPVEVAIAKTGCLEEHWKVQECMAEKQDWRQCQEYVQIFRKCIASGPKKNAEKK